MGYEQDNGTARASLVRGEERKVLLKVTLDALNGRLQGGRDSRDVRESCTALAIPDRYEEAR